MNRVEIYSPCYELYREEYETKEANRVKAGV